MADLFFFLFFFFFNDTATTEIYTLSLHDALPIFQRHRWRAFVDQFAERIGDLQQFIDALAAFVAGVVARVAAFAVEKILRADIAAGKAELVQERLARLVGRAALRTDA